MQEPNNVKEFLGVGFHFPIEVDPLTGRIKMVSHEEDIAQAILLILKTRIGERVMRPTFGCGIHDFAFGTMDYTSICQMQGTIKDAMILWEPRIKDVEVGVAIEEGDTGKLRIDINYVVRSTNNPYNLVYPFYINEGIQ